MRTKPIQVYFLSMIPITTLLVILDMRSETDLNLFEQLEAVILK